MGNAAIYDSILRQQKESRDSRRKKQIAKAVSAKERLRRTSDRLKQVNARKEAEKK